MPFFRRVSRKGEEDTAAMLSPDQVGALWSPGHLTMPPALMTALIQRGACDVIDVVLSLLHAVDILLPETGSYFRSCVRTAALPGSVFLHTPSKKPQASGDSDLRCSVSTFTLIGCCDLQSRQNTL